MYPTARWGRAEAYGKSALVGIELETKQGAALIHNFRFGKVYHKAVGGTELRPSAEKLSLPGVPIDIPLKLKIDAKIRSHRQRVGSSIPDAPMTREIVIACAPKSRQAVGAFVGTPVTWIAL